MGELPLGNDTDLSDSQFFNRTKEINFFHDTLDLTKNGSTPTILLTGIRGVGKTALMKKLKRDFKDEYLVVYMDLSAMNKFKKDKLSRMEYMKLFYESILKSCQESKFKRLYNYVEKCFKTNNFKIDRFTSINKIPIPLISSEEDYTKFTNFVMALPQKIYDENKENIKGILIFIDEFQILKQLDEDVNGFLWYIRSVIQTQNNIGYIFSGSISLKDDLIRDIAGQKGAFGGRIMNYEIKTFSFETTREYLKEKADYLEFTEKGIERFHLSCKGTPYYINTFARLLPPNEKLDEEKIKSEYKKALPILSVNFSNEWYKLKTQEQRIITSLLDGPLRRIEIAERLGVTSGAIGNSLKTLQNKTLIEMEQNKYQIVDSIFKEWLISEFEEMGDYPY